MQSPGSGFRSELEAVAASRLGCRLGHLQPSGLRTVLAKSIEDRCLSAMARTRAEQDAAGGKIVYYLSLEFLMGRSLANNLHALGLYADAAAAIGELGHNLTDLLEGEPDAALGNGGLGRLAACYLDSMATLGIDGHGYGLNYEYGLFRQGLQDRRQTETPDEWRRDGSPWLVRRDDRAIDVPVGGNVGYEISGDRWQVHWAPAYYLHGVPSDMAVLAHGGRSANRLRLFAAEPTTPFDFQAFSAGDYAGASHGEVMDRRVSRLLYPNDQLEAGRELRLLQEYFFSYCSVHDMLQDVRARYGTLERLSERVALQLNDTHPVLAIPELMRVLLDEECRPWDEAWDTVRKVFAYTNHTLLPEALEVWGADVLIRIAPRHAHIINEINRRFVAEAAAEWGSGDPKVGRAAIIAGNPPQQVRMANLAIVSSHAVNGVARIHTELVRRTLVPELASLWPGRFQNKTNGVTPRRWLAYCNPPLRSILDDLLGADWVCDLDRLAGLEEHLADPGVRERFRAAKQQNKRLLAGRVLGLCGATVDPSSLFDVQIKRFHEYKRQLLHLLYVIHEYITLVDDGVAPAHGRVHLFAGKAAAGYWAAKEIIRLVLHVADVINHDPKTEGRLRLVMLPDYRVSLAEAIIPAADLSEQISTAGTEASGTGNMKLALNGAVTIGTMDGANIEIREAVGDENIVTFGLSADEVMRVRSGGYRPMGWMEARSDVRRVVDALASGRLTPDDRGLDSWICHYLVSGQDQYLHLADFGAYIDAQSRVSAAFEDAERWTTMSMLNVARCGRFSSDRAVREYADEVWGVPVRG